jgi:putative transposase
MVFHVLNRGVGRKALFRTPADYGAFEEVMIETLAIRPMRLLAYCLMPDHWHLVLWPREEGQLGAFMQRLSITHARRWQENRRLVGRGHVYQGRYKSFPVQQDDHFLAVCRYVERNALRAGLVRRAEAWRWSSLWQRVRKDSRRPEWLADWPVARPVNWLGRVNAAETAADLAALRVSVARGRPFGTPNWIKRTASRLGVESSLRPRGRPRKQGRSDGG